jgi:hypothetical protein
VTLPHGYALPASLPIYSLGEALVQRICTTAHAAKEPAFRATGAYRFDDPKTTYGVLYCAPTFGTCFLETLMRSGRLTVSRAAYDARSVVPLLLDVRRVHLVDLYTTAGVAALGLDLSILAAPGYADTQALSALAHAHAQRPHGFVYRSRFDPDEPAIALFERAKRLLRIFPGAAPAPLATVAELSDAVRNRVPFVFV